jgi:2-polyprenyl-6-methoxyphenol hydroxylase-like FAD-dependent oxidoreductase
MSSRSTQFRVLITGGGIAGLTLANALQHAGIDYLLLEARDDFAPQLGASIGIGPNGGRILDQLGCYGDIMANTVPLDHTSSRNSKGGYIRPKTDGFRLVQARSNYCMCFLDRQTVLSILAKHICDKKKLLLNKRIVQADESPDGVTIICKDGTTYSGDILVGADGAHSIVRHEMWRAAELRSPGEISDEEKGSMFAEYRCIYAISKSIPGLPPREFAVTFKKDVTPIVITSREDRVYWFLIERMPEIRRYGQIPRFNKTDAEALVAKHMEIPLTDDGNITVNDLWQNCITHSIVPLEEAFYKHWSFGRFVCLGDSAHKMTPNSGSGGNSAIEGAAALANELHSLVQHNRRPGSSVPTESISTALSNYQKTRQIRASATVTAANYVTRFHALRGLAEYISANYLMPYSGDLLVDLASDTWIGAVRIRYLPLPQRSMLGTMPFNPEQGTGKNESMLIRAAAAAPFLLISIYGLQPQGDGSKPIAVPSLAELMDLGVIYGLILMESTRRASTLTPIQMYVQIPPNFLRFLL